MRKIFAVGLVAVGVSGCVSAEQQQQIYDGQVAPSGEVRSTIVSYVKTTYFDPYSIRDAEISNVVTIPGAGLQAVCVRANAKNRLGAYAGLSATSVRIQGGRPVSFLSDAPACNDARLTYHPFPELEGL